MDTSYGVSDERTTTNGFREWAVEETREQRRARELVLSVPQFVELERLLIGTLGPTAEAIMMHQLCYWFRQEEMRGRWTAWKTREEWRDERGLNRKQVDRGKKRLESCGVVETRLGAYRRVHYRVNWVALAFRIGLAQAGEEEF